MEILTKLQGTNQSGKLLGCVRVVCLNDVEDKIIQLNGSKFVILWQEKLGALAVVKRVTNETFKSQFQF